MTQRVVIDVVEVGDVVAVEVGEEHRAGRRPAPDAAPAARMQHAPAAVEQQVADRGPHQGGRSGPVGGSGWGCPLPRMTTCMATTPRSVRHLYDRDYDMNCTPSRHDAQYGPGGWVIGSLTGCSPPACWTSPGR